MSTAGKVGADAQCEPAVRDMEAVYVPPKRQQHCPYHRMHRLKNRLSSAEFAD
jgi:hypothetical protein